MKKVIRLTESDLRKIVQKVILEENRLKENDTEDVIHYVKIYPKKDPNFVSMGAIDSRNPNEVPIIFNFIDLGFIVEKATKEEYEEHLKNDGASFNMN